MPREKENSITAYRREISRHQNQVTDNPRSQKPSARNVGGAGLGRKQYLALLMFSMILSADMVNANAPEFRFIMGDSLSPKQKNNCNKVKKEIAALRKKLRHVDDAISLGGDALTVSCDNVKNPSSNADAFFNAGTQTIQLDGNTVPPRELISHEHIHARAFFANRRCGAPIEFTTFPLNPVNRFELKKLNDAFDAGDARIAEFKQLTLKNNSGKKLTKEEQTKLSAYNAACKDVIIAKHTIFMRKGDYERVASALKKSSPYRTHVDSLGGGIFAFNEAGFDPLTKRYYASGLPDPQTAVIIIPDTVKRNLATFKGSPKELILAEREAYTFQTLPERSQQVFYKEAYELRQANIAACEKKKSSQRFEL